MSQRRRIHTFDHAVTASDIPLIQCFPHSPSPLNSIQTSYVTVEPKRRKQLPGSPPQHPSSPALQPAVSTLPPSQFGDPSLQQAQQQHGRARPLSGRELRRARIVITVKRTESYKQWLEENPLQAIIAGDGSEDQEEAATPSPDT